MKLALVLELAPPTPACFHDRVSWAEYLVQCQGEKRDQLRPFAASNTYRPDFNFCRDCSKQHAEAMSSQGKCHPVRIVRRAAVVIEQS